MPSNDHGGRRWLLVGGLLLGVGVGAVVDVLLFHLVLQQHHLLSGRVDPGTASGLARNVRYDGLFSLGMLAVAALGFASAWRGLNAADRRRSPVGFAGSLLLGAGLFNLFDGVVDHYLLGLHDVVHGTARWNPHWVGVSLLLLAAGGLVLWTNRRRRDDPNL